MGLVAAAHGRAVTLALTENGQVFSWGLAPTLGRPFVPETFTKPGDRYPGLVSDAAGALRDMVAVSTGAPGAMGLTQDGCVYAWGPYAEAAYPDPANLVPQRLSLPSQAISLTSGQNWAAILLANGRVVSWRSGPGSDVPFNTTGRPVTPGAIGLNVGDVIDNRTGAPLEGVVKVAAGASHGLALMHDGQVLAWGQNNLGQRSLGNANDAPVGATPVSSADGATTLSGITAVARGGNHSLALETMGRIYSWGLGTSRQLVDDLGQPRANNAVRGVRPELVLDSAGTSALTGVRAVYGSTANSLALMADGRVLIWGLRGSHDLGQGLAATPPLYQGLPLAVLNEAGGAPLVMTPMAYWPDLGRRGTPPPLKGAGISRGKAVLG